MSQKTYEVGDRVSVNDYIGTIRYRGPVKNAKGEYYGVEWDVASRGKHNGTHDGQVYFCTRNGQNSGSFIKGKLISPAVSCLEAIKDRYGKVEDEYSGIDESEAYLSQAGHSRVINIEVVGMKKLENLQSQFDLLRIVDVSWMCVDGEVDSEGLGKLVPKTDELNLAHNLLTSWQAVGDIIRKLQQLTFLHLSGNRLSYSDVEVERLKEDFRKIKRLNLVQMGMSWQEVASCSQLWLHIQELHLCSNAIRQVNVSPDFHSLKILNLAGNTLASWSNVKPFAGLPELQELLLSECHLSDISVENGDFPSLRSLDLRGNLINEWKYVGQLNKMSHLNELIFMSNPVLNEADGETNRQIIIAKVAHLTKHNRTDIDGKERKGAEIDYLSRYGEEWIKAGASTELNDSNAEFYTEHPTYLDIIAKWGAPEKTEVKKSKPKSAIKESLIEVTFVDLVTESGKSVTKYIPYTMSVLKCRNLAIKLLGIKGIPSVITYRSHTNEEEYDFEYDLRQLSFYGVQHGDDILLRQVA